MATAQDGSMMNYFPVKKVSIPVDSALVRGNGTVNADDRVLPEVRFEIPKNLLLKNDMAVLNVVAANKWQRPIYFTSLFNELGFGRYLRNDGMCYRLVPVEGQNMVNDGWAYGKLLKDYAFGGAATKGVYFDEENRRHLLGIRQAYAEISASLASNGRKEEAKRLMNRLDSNMREDNIPYGMPSRQNQHNMVSAQLLEAAILSGDSTLSKKIGNALRKDINEQLAYYAYLGGMSTQQMTQAVQDVMTNRADNLSNRQRGLFLDIRQALALQEYLRNLDNLNRKPEEPSVETPGTLRNAADSGPRK
jgi:hypothetical protein